MWAETMENGIWKMVSDMPFENDMVKYSEDYRNRPYFGRNYEFFSLLADVRNSYGIVPISKPRGIPSDASHGYLHQVESMEGDGHSHSYFTLAELKRVDTAILEQEFHDGRLIVAKDENGKIIETCSWTTRETMGEVGTRKLFSLWGDNPLKNLIANLELLGKENEEVRIVFFFDN